MPGFEWVQVEAAVLPVLDERFAAGGREAGFCIRGVWLMATRTAQGAGKVALDRQRQRDHVLEAREEKRRRRRRRLLRAVGAASAWWLKVAKWAR